MASAGTGAGGVGSLAPEKGAAGTGSGLPRLVVVVVLLLLALVPAAWWALAEGTLTIESIPPGATVTVDGRAAGVTPLKLSARLSAVAGEAELRLEGYQSQRLPYRVEPRQNSTLSATLQAATASAEIRSTPPGAAVYLDGTQVGATPLVVNSLSLAPHRLVLKLSNYKDWSQDLTPSTGQRAAVEAALVALPGTVSVATSPAEARVFVDGKEAGVSPLRLENVEPGDRVVKVVKPGFEEWVKTVNVGPGGSVEVQATLQRPRQAEATFNRPIAVMVDNHPEARPQSGLSAADVVYEAVAEGGVTRFMAIFASRGAEVVGPVRSARHYFVYWADEYDAMYVHCGGYSEALDAIKATGIADFDDLRGAPGFWRGNAKPAPYNLYTSTAALREAAAGMGYKKDKGSYGGLRFEDVETPAAGELAGRIAIHYPLGYTVKWQYAPGSNDYARFHGDWALRDSNTGEQLRGSNVVVMYAKNWFIGRDDQQDLAQVGSGRALFFMDGVASEGTWTRDSLGEPTLFWGANGERVQLNKGGTTWIQVVPLNTEVTFD